MKRLILAFLMTFASWALADSAFTVKSVEAHQRYPWNGLVDIVVTIQGDVNNMYRAECSFVGQNSGTMSTVTISEIKQVGDDVISGDVCVRRFLWNAVKDIGAVKIDDFVLTVSVKRGLGGVQLWENGPYWAECNVGATCPEERGVYCRWGDGMGYKFNGLKSYDGYYTVSSWLTHQGWEQPSSPFVEPSHCYDKNYDTIPESFDLATGLLGNPWRMPTESECAALVSNCTWKWTTRNGVYGTLVTGKGSYVSKSVFFPAAGYCFGNYFVGEGVIGHYWSSTRDRIMALGSGKCFVDHAYSEACYGLSVRAVRSCVK